MISMTEKGRKEIERRYAHRDGCALRILMRFA